MPFNEWPWVLPIVLLLTIPPMRSYTLNPVHFSDCSAGEGKVGLFTELPLKRLNPSQPAFGILYFNHKDKLDSEWRNHLHIITATHRPHCPYCQSQKFTTLAVWDCNASTTAQSTDQLYLHWDCVWEGVLDWSHREQEDDGQDPRPPIKWHDITHDEASFNDLQVLSGLVATL